MHLSMKKATILVAAAFCGWLVRGSIRHEEPVEPGRPAVSSQAVPPRSDPGMDPVPRIDRFEPPPETGGRRNLFSYREHAPIRERFVTPSAVVEVRADKPAIPVDTPPQPPAEAPFPYELVGAFGTKDLRLAAFSKEGYVISVREGEAIDHDFVLASTEEGVKSGLETRYYFTPQSN
jgi:hypothetical protein